MIHLSFFLCRYWSDLDGWRGLYRDWRHHPSVQVSWLGQNQLRPCGGRWCDLCRLNLYDPDTATATKHLQCLRPLRSYKVHNILPLPGGVTLAVCQLTNLSAVQWSKSAAFFSTSWLNIYLQDWIMGAKKMHTFSKLWATMWASTRGWSPNRTVHQECFIRLNYRVFSEGQRSAFCHQMLVWFVVFASCIGRKRIQQLHHRRAFIHLSAVVSELELKWCIKKLTRLLLTNWFFIYWQLLFALLCRNGFWVMLNIQTALYIYTYV